LVPKGFEGQHVPVALSDGELPEKYKSPEAFKKASEEEEEEEDNV
jgi:hypothetical protein